MNSSEIISIDPSLRSTGVYLDNILYTIATKQKRPAAEARKNLYTQLRGLIRDNRPTLCLVEDYSYGNKMSTSMTSIAEIRGIIYAICLEYHCSVVPVGIPIWKNIMHYKHPKAPAAAKRAYVQIAEDKWELGFATTDEVDAFMIYTTVERLLKTGPRTDSQKRLIIRVKECLNE